MTAVAPSSQATAYSSSNADDSRACGKPPGVVFLFRNDLRLHDQPALLAAIREAENLKSWLLPLYIHDAAQLVETKWGFPRSSPRRRAWLDSALSHLSHGLESAGSGLMQCHGDPAAVLTTLVRDLGHPLLICEDVPAPEERRLVQDLRAAGLSLQTVWHSTLMSPSDLPFPPEQVPDTFTVFRQAVERAPVPIPSPLPAPVQLPPWPSHLRKPDLHDATSGAGLSDIPVDARTSFPMHRPEFHGGEAAALAHLRRYCQRCLPHRYKSTRNELTGVDYSSKWSPWLATGALSPRQAWETIRSFEAEHGTSDSTYWLWFELLWRDHFRWLHCKYGGRLYRGGGLRSAAQPPHDPAAFAHWCEGRAGHAFIDAGMRELAATGYLSNRMRQNVASFLIHDLRCDWRAGAAWFESQLIDYDPCSNQGNWLYLSGCGTDPRGNRRFDPDKQARDYDPDGAYRRLWKEPA